MTNEEFLPMSVHKVETDLIFEYEQQISHRKMIRDTIVDHLLPAYPCFENQPTSKVVEKVRSFVTANGVFTAARLCKEMVVYPKSAERELEKLFEAGYLGKINNNERIYYIRLDAVEIK